MVYAVLPASTVNTVPVMVFRTVPEQEFDGVRNVFDTRQSLQGAASHDLPSFCFCGLSSGGGPLKGFASMNRRISNAQL
jgi:hypothetical protein